MRLIQFQNYGLHNYVITADSLDVKINGITTTVEESIPFEEIVLNRIERKKVKDTRFFFLALIVLFVFLFQMYIDIFSKAGKPSAELKIYGIVLVAIVLIWIVISRKYYSIPTTQNGFILVNSNFIRKPKVDSFISKLKNDVYQNLREKYIKLHHDPSTQSKLEILLTLQEHGIVSKEEFKELKALHDLKKGR